MKTLFAASMSLFALSACQPTPVITPVNPAGPVPTPTATATGGTPPAPAPTPAPGLPTSSPSPMTGGEVLSPNVPLPVGLASIRIETTERFLNGQGETTRLRVTGLDAQGQALAGALPLSFTLSRPQDFSISPEGLITALKDFGFTEVTIRVQGTDLEARTIVSVSLPSTYSGGGGGGASLPPVNQSPTIGLTTTATTVNGTGTLIRLEGQGVDPEGNPVTYTWSCLDDNCGDFSAPSAALTYWRSPATAGTYRLLLTISDGTRSSTLQQPITVVTGTGRVDVQVGPRIWFVKQGETGQGLSWSNAFGTLQEALAVAQSGDEIRVAEGTYYPSDTGDRSASFALAEGVTIYGGFDSVAPVSHPTERNLASDITVLSGEIGDSGLLNDNSCTVVKTANASVLDGFTITAASGGADGYCNFSTDNLGDGGGLYHSATSATLRNLNIVANRAYFGGGIASVNGAGLILESVLLQDNVANSAGGMGIEMGGDFTLDHVVFEGNQGSLGGGLSATNAQLSLNHVVFHENTIGGGFFSNISEAHLNQVVFNGNTHSNVFLSGAGITAVSSEMHIQNAVFNENRSFQGSGAGITASDTTLTLLHTTFSRNSAITIGGILFNGPNIALANNLFWQSALSFTLPGNPAANGSGHIADDQGNIIVADAIDPFVECGDDPAGSDGEWFTDDDCLRLRADAFPVGKGLIDLSLVPGFESLLIPLQDIRGLARPQPNGPNAGAYEGADSAPVS